MTKKLLNKAEAAEYLGIGDNAFDRLAYNGDIDAVLLPGASDFRYSVADLDAFVENLPRVQAVRRTERPIATNPRVRATNRATNVTHLGAVPA